MGRIGIYFNLDENIFERSIFDTSVLVGEVTLLSECLENQRWNLAALDHSNRREEISVENKREILAMNFTIFILSKRHCRQRKL